MSPQSPNQDNSDQLAVDIDADGRSIDSSFQVLSVETWSAVNTSPRARIVLIDGSPEEGFPISSLETFLPGRPIEIRAGYGGKLDRIFSGVVVTHGIEITNAGGSTLVVEAADPAITIVGPPDASRPPVLTIMYGESIIDFRASMDASSAIELERARLTRVRGHVSFQGSAMVAPGEIIELSGVGNRFSGNVFVSGVHHDIKSGEWVTRADFGVSPDRPPD